MLAIAEENVDFNVDKKDNSHDGRPREDIESTVTDLRPCADDKLRLLEARLDAEEELPVPWLHRLSPYITIPIWISLSGGMILFNRWIFTTKGFAFPAFLTAYHMVVAIIGTNILRLTTNLLPEAENPLPKRIWTNAIVPIGLLYSFSLVLSNAAYIHLSVSLVQMMKASLGFETGIWALMLQASIPVLVHLISCAVGIARMNAITALILVMIGSGCVIASTGQVRYNFLGLACQSGAIVAEASRLVVVQVLLRDIKMNPLLGLYNYAPVSLAAIAFAFPFLEGTRPFYMLPNLGWRILFANGLMSFGLNVASVLLIRSSGSVVSTLSGVLKDIILIFLSVVLLGSVISLQQVLGYGIALVGLIMFRDKERLVGWLQNNKSRSVGTPV